MPEEPEEPRVSFADLLEGFTTARLSEGDQVISVFAIVKSVTFEQEVVWAGRSGGAEISSEELLGVLMALAGSLRDDLAKDWEW
jgi:hypothetical protein